MTVTPFSAITFPRMETLVSAGCSLAYRVEGNGPPVLFIQGTGVQGAAWAPQVDALKDAYRCLLFDNRGMGRSQPVGARITVEQMAADALALLEHQGWERAHVVGHSLGGLIALRLALSARLRIRSLSLLCTFARGRDATPLTLSMLWTGLRTRIGTRPQRRRAFLELVLPPGRRTAAEEARYASELGTLFGHDLAVQPRIVMKQLRAMGMYDATPRLRELAGLPTLVVSAGQDRIAPPELGRALAAGIPGAVYHEVPDAAHGLPVYRAPEVNHLLRQHFERADGVAV